MKAFFSVTGRICPCPKSNKGGRVSVRSWTSDTPHSTSVGVRLERVVFLGSANRLFCLYCRPSRPIDMGYLSLLVICVLATGWVVEGGDIMRKSIVYDKKTPKVFYCPQEKPTDKMIVKAKPLSKLCEFDGKPLPANYKSDCYKDVDETEYACKEKYRIMMRLHPPGSEDKEATKWERAYKKFTKHDRRTKG